jgi:HK97 gp10 family phage protein
MALTFGMLPGRGAPHDMHIRFRIHGLQELDRRLEVLPQVVAKRTLASALRIATVPLVRDIKAHAPVLTGELRDSIAVTSHPEEGANEVRLQIGVTGVYYGHFQEFGTSKMRARPFVRPAWDRNRRGLVTRFRDLLRQRIDEYVEGNLRTLLGPERLARTRQRGGPLIR